MSVMPVQAKAAGRFIGAWRWFRANVLPGILITLNLLLLLAIAGEFFLRAKRPFRIMEARTYVDERVGFHFVPGSRVRWTNYLDFWVETPINSLGFADREPPPTGPGSTCRVAFIGDSFVEALQVPIEQKSHVVFERLAQQQLAGQRAIETMAFGYSGTGQANQLATYDAFVRQFEPEVVVLVFVGNDFANNSPVLEAVRNGWHPDRPPRLFYERTASGDFREIQIDTGWLDHMLVEPQSNPSAQFIFKDVLGQSELYNELLALVSFSARDLPNQLIGAPRLNDLYRERMRLIADLKAVPPAALFGAWDPGILDIDSVFATEELPPVFEQAIYETGYALDQFVARSQQDDFTLIVLATSQLHVMYDGRGLVYERLDTLAQERGLPVVDQHAYLVSHGLDQSPVSFRHDGHWNASGHLWAAQALLEYFDAHPALCQ